MKINLKDLMGDDKPAGVIEGQALVYSFPSGSRPGLKHYVMRFDTEDKCTCEGYQNHKKCWHIKKVKDGNEEV